AGALEDVERVGAGRDDCGLQTRGSHLAHVVDRSRVRVDPVLADPGEDEVVLAVAQPLDGRRTGWVALVALRQVDATRGEEVAGAVEARLAVDVAVVVCSRGGLDV